MKLVVLLVAIPLLVAAYDGESLRVLDVIKEISEGLKGTLTSGEDRPIDPKNFVYDLIIKIIKEKLTAEIEVPVIGEPGGLLYVENGTIFGANETFIGIVGPAGYNIDNLTVFIPSLDIYGDKYTINNLKFEGIDLSGEGPLHIYLENIQMHARMEISFENLRFVVKSITTLTFSVENSKCELENLGGSGDDVSSLLNDITMMILPKLITSASNDLDDIVQAAGGSCSDPNLDLICAIISELLTYLKNNLV